MRRVGAAVVQLLDILDVVAILDLVIGGRDRRPGPRPPW
jgi:hypothetical protein